MSPLEDDPTIWEAVMRFIKSCFEWFASFSGLVVPALAGAVVGAFKEDRRKSGRRKLLFSIFMSAACGCGLAPLFAHLFGMPATVASSLAFFLGIWGLEGIEVVQNVIRSRSGANRDNSTSHDE